MTEDIIEWVLDTETTGLNPKQGHRIVEIGCVQLVNKKETGEHYHVYINPERDMPDEAYKIHGLSTDFLKKHRPFKEIAREFFDLIQGTKLIIHNAGFDVRFMNAEFDRLGMPMIEMAHVVDTLMMARKRFPGSPASLDALCKRFQVDNTEREKHGALLDAELLAKVYVAMTGEPQSNIRFDGLLEKKKMDDTHKEYREARAFNLTPEEQQAHQAMIKRLKKPIWTS